MFVDLKNPQNLDDVLEADTITIRQKNIDSMSPRQPMNFLQEMFQMAAIVLFSVINHDHINGLRLFWDIL